MDVIKYFLISFILAYGAFSQAHAQEAIGVAAVVNNQVTATLTEKVRHLRVGVDVFENELITTSADSKTQLIFNDESVLTMGPNSQLTLDSMIYDPGGKKGKMLVSVTAGVFKFISGSMPSAKYEVKTPIATIGMRGTAFDLLVAASGATTAILRQGIITITNLLTGISQEINTLGLASTISSPSSDPTKPAPPTASVNSKLGAFAGGTSTGSGLGNPTELPSGVTDLISPHVVHEITSDPASSGKVECDPYFKTC